MLRDCNWIPVFAKEASTRIEERQGFQKHMIRFQHAGLEISTQERVELILYNSHDGCSAFNLSASIWRKVCSNGLIVANPYLTFSHRHIRFSEANFIESASIIAHSANQLSQEIDSMKEITLTPNDRGVYALSAHQLIYDDIHSSPIHPSKLLVPKRNTDTNTDLWTTFNVVQENMIKGGVRGNVETQDGRTRTIKTRAVKSIDRDIKLNKALWTLTEEMKKIKTA